MSFNKDALLHKLQDELETKDEQIKVLEQTWFDKMRNCLYGFIDYYEQNELNRTDLKIIADKYLKEEYDE